MTTATISGPINNQNDAGFRAWVSDIITLLAAAGLVQTADTGQVDVLTVLKPTNTTVTAYTIWCLPDSSLYFRIGFGQGTSSNPNQQPKVEIRVGEGSDGAGNLTGVLSTNLDITGSTNGNSDINSASFPHLSYACVTNDYFGFIWGNYANSSSLVSGIGHYGMFACGKTVNNAGTATNLGYYVLTTRQIGSSSTTAPVFQFMKRTAPTSVGSQTSGFCLVPGATASNPTYFTNDSGQALIYVHWGLFPEKMPLIYTCTVRSGAVIRNMCFRAALVGNTPRTYMWLGGGSGGSAEASQTNTNFRVAILWE